MKILIMDGSDNLVWQDVVYKQGMFYKPESPTCWYQHQIYSIKDDDRNKLTICSACGKEISNTPSAIKAHRNMINKPNKCFECAYLSTINATTILHKYTLSDDGTYTEATKRKVSLVCNSVYRNYDINSSSAKQVCKYARCENASFRKVEDFWTKYPNAFDEFITIDKFIEDGQTNLYRYSSEIIIELTGRLNLTALINNQGLCYEFILRYYSNAYHLRYSKKYDKMWVFNSNCIELEKSEISESTQKQILKKLRSLYE